VCFLFLSPPLDELLAIFLPTNGQLFFKKTGAGHRDAFFLWEIRGEARRGSAGWRGERGAKRRRVLPTGNTWRGDARVGGVAGASATPRGDALAGQAPRGDGVGARPGPPTGRAPFCRRRIPLYLVASTSTRQQGDRPPLEKSRIWVVKQVVMVLDTVDESAETTTAETGTQ